MYYKIKIINHKDTIFAELVINVFPQDTIIWSIGGEHNDSDIFSDNSTVNSEKTGQIF